MMKNMNNNNLRFLSTILALLVIIAGPYLLKQSWNGELKKEIIQLAGVEEKFKVKQNIKNPFEDLDLEATSVYVLDIVSGKSLYSYNENTKLPLASLTKMMTAIVATDLVPNSTVVIVDKNDISTEGDSGLLVGERWRMSDIIDFTLTTSSNDGASAIATVAGSLGQNSYGVSSKQAKADFVNKMNLKTEEIGLSKTYFLNESGLDLNKNQSGSYGTAKEVASLMAYILKNKSGLMEATSRDKFLISSLNNVGHMATNTNQILAYIPGLLASKTGFTDLAGGNLVVAFDAGMMHPIVISVLGSSADGRFSDVEKLVWASLKSLQIN